MNADRMRSWKIHPTDAMRWTRERIAFLERELATAAAAGAPPDAFFATELVALRIAFPLMTFEQRRRCGLECEWPAPSVDELRQAREELVRWEEYLSAKVRKIPKTWKGWIENPTRILHTQHRVAIRHAIVILSRAIAGDTLEPLAQPAAKEAPAAAPAAAPAPPAAAPPRPPRRRIVVAGGRS